MEKKERIDFLDYLKAICVILVVVTHYDWQSKHSYIFTMFINMAVPVFMIISGYNFAMSYKRKTNGTMKQMYSPRVIIPKLENCPPSRTQILQLRESLLKKLRR